MATKTTKLLTQTKTEKPNAFSVHVLFNKPPTQRNYKALLSLVKCHYKQRYRSKLDICFTVELIDVPPILVSDQTSDSLLQRL